MDTHQLTHIFCQIDDFCKDFVHFTENKLLPASSGQKRRGPACSLSDSEIMTILVAFQSSGYRNFKIFYVVTWDRVNTLAFRRTLQYGILGIWLVKLSIEKWSIGKDHIAYMT